MRVLIMIALVLSISRAFAQPVTYNNDFSSDLSGDWTTVNGTWVVSSGVLQQTNSVAADPKKLLLTKSGYYLSSSVSQQVLARVRVDVWNGNSEDRAGVCLMSTTSSSGHRGYSFLLRPGNKVNLLSDGLAWSTEVSFTWSSGTWYWMKLKITGTNLSGKIWAYNSSEPETWTITQSLGITNWDLVNGYPGLTGSSAATTTSSYDDFTVDDPSAFVVDNPTSFVASPVSSIQIDMTWVKNGSGNDVMVAWNTSNTFGNPSGSYTVGNSISGGGTVIYNGFGTSVSHAPISPNTAYYYKAWSVNGTSYSNSVTTSATSLPIYYYTDFSSGLGTDLVDINGTWSVNSGVLEQTNTSAYDPKKLLLQKDGFNLPSSSPQQVVARVRVNVWNGGEDDRTGICLMSNLSNDNSHRGYSFLLRPGNMVNFLSDKLAWGTAVSFSWTTGTWYWMKMKIMGTTLSGKIWADGSSEPGTWTMTQTLGGTNWNLTSGYPGFVGSSIATTTSSFDDLTVSDPSVAGP
ncbi:MAG: hypothetical protein NTU44_16200, partial [Bacteroidetes bacterium]|nr:hypothetical protein [Bacteroidota bacterium]